MENIPIPRKYIEQKKKEDKNITRHKIFVQHVSEGDICVYTLCQQTWLRDQVTTVKQLQSTQYHNVHMKCCTGNRSCENLELVCSAKMIN